MSPAAPSRDSPISRGRFAEAEDHDLRNGPSYNVETQRRPRTAHGGAPTLPPIPRVTSQYGGSLAQLENIILDLHRDDSTSDAQPDSFVARRPATAGGGAPESRTAGVTFTSFSAAESSGLTKSPPRPSTSSSNFSRPMQGNLVPAAAPAAQPSSFLPSMNAPVPETLSPAATSYASLQPLQQHDPSSQWPAPIAETRVRMPFMSEPPARSSPASMRSTMPPPPRPQPETMSMPVRSTMPPPLRAPPQPQPPANALPSTPVAEPPAPPSPRKPTEAASKQGAKSFSRPFNLPHFKSRDRPPPLVLVQDSGASTESNARLKTTSWSSSESASNYTTQRTIALGSSAKPKQPIFTRFNPMSLLSRRKSPHSPQPLQAEVFSPPLPDDFDPSIRGHLVHDFSAPRTKASDSAPFRDTADSNHNRNGLGSAATTLRPIRQREAPRTPVFTEHFDDTNGWRLDDTDRRNQDSTGIAERVPTDFPNHNTTSTLPVFARRVSKEMLSLMPAPAPPQRALPPTLDARASATNPPPETAIKQGSSASIEEARQSAATPEPNGSPKSEKKSAHASPRSIDGVPVRLKSNASRFSFDLAGVGSAAQEKLLEDRHRERAAQKARESTVSGISIVESDDDNGYDDMDMDDGFVEDFPGMDDDDESFPGGGVSNFTLPSTSSEPFAHPLAALNTSWNVSAAAKSLVDESTSQAHDERSETNTFAAENGTNVQQSALGVQDQVGSAVTLKEIESRIARGNFVDDDDLYFDDGMMDSADLAAGEAFDESLFDDEESKIYGIPLRDQPKPAPTNMLPSDSSQLSTRPMSMESSAVIANQAHVTNDTSRTSVQQAEWAQARKMSIAEWAQPGGLDTSASLTQDNLAAYHDALAFAANKAAMEGRFDRKVSFDETSSMPQNRVSFSLQDATGNTHSFDDDMGIHGGFDDLDGLDDDAIIAEANAEALENDEDGFYGQEFGFYARSNGDEAERVNGGYFGTGFEAMVKRSHSGRAGGQDPSLTPITERSEWSQRNSMISLVMQGGMYGAPVVSPGLAQLAAAEATHDEDNLSLSALMRLRRGAFGDSTTSLHSSAGSHKSGSPSNVVLSPSIPGVPPFATGFNGQVLRSGSPNNFPLRSPEMGPPPQPLTSPLLHAHSQAMPPQAMTFSPQPMPVESSAGFAPPLRAPPSMATHSRNSSGAESVTYVKDQDGSWVMERRRTSEYGEVEILGRQVLESGRI